MRCQTKHDFCRLTLALTNTIRPLQEAIIESVIDVVALKK